MIQVKVMGIAALLILIVMLSGCGQATELPVEMEREDVAKFAAHLDTRVPAWMANYRVPGVVINIWREGEVIYSEAFGERLAGGGEALQTDDFFQMASISQALTALGVLKLAEEGLIQLDQPINQQLKSWQLPTSDVYDVSLITPQRLMDHQAGLNHSSYPGFEPTDDLPTLIALLEGESNGMGPLQIVRQPGSRAHQSAGGYALLQLLIEDVTGEPFENWMEAQILTPLGMVNSTFRQGEAANLAQPHTLRKRPMPVYQYVATGAQGLYSTVDDLMMMMNAFMPAAERGAGVVEDATIQTVLASESTEIYPFAFGWVVENLFDGALLLSSPANNRGYRNYMAMIPEQEEMLLILTNSDTGMDLIVNALESWSYWLQYPPMTTARSYTSLRQMIYLAFGFLMLSMVVYLAIKFNAVIKGKRTVELSLFPITARKVIRLLLVLLIAYFWWRIVYTLPTAEDRPPIVFATLMPTAINWLTAAVYFWCVALILPIFLPIAQSTKKKKMSIHELALESSRRRQQEE